MLKNWNYEDYSRKFGKYSLKTQVRIIYSFCIIIDDAEDVRKILLLI